MTLKVGELYKARNGKAVRIIEAIGGGMFTGQTGEGLENAQVMYRADGSTLAFGWRDWSIDGLSATSGGIKQEQPDGSTRYWFDIDDVKDLAERRLKSLEKEARRYTAGRMDDLEGQIRDIRRAHDNTCRAIRANGGLIADLAAKVDEDVRRLDCTDRCVAALSEGLNESDDDTNRRLHQLETDVTTVGDRVAAHTDLLAEMTGKIEILGQRIGSSDYAFKEMTAREIYSRLEKLESRMTGVGGIFEANKRIAALEQALARIEDMLTAEKPKIDHHDGTVKGCECYICQRLRAEAKPKRVIKGGWINLWAEGSRAVAGPAIYSTRDAADDAARRDEGTRIACIQIPNITEGEGL